MALSDQECNSGLDILVKQGFGAYKNKNVAILSNQASINKKFRQIIDLASQNKLKLVKLFAPEHGLYATRQDMETLGEELYEPLNMPITSLYNKEKESLRLKKEDLKGVDILLCDLMDIGTRYYTFYCTIAYAMEACQKASCTMVVLDRPNPINSDTTEGNIIKKENFSFVGAYPLLNRHGFTLAEVTNYIKKINNITLDLQIVKMENYNRKSYLDETGLPFVYPSPNMPNLSACITYPGLCLLEGTNISEGRGTCYPFELIGAPYIKNAHKFKEDLEKLYSAGVSTRAMKFIPKFQKHKDQECRGIFVHITDRNSFRPLRFALAFLSLAMKEKGFSYRKEAYEFEHNRLAIDLLLGDQMLRSMLEKSAGMDEIDSYLHEHEALFSKRRQEYLLY